MLVDVWYSMVFSAMASLLWELWDGVVPYFRRPLRFRGRYRGIAGRYGRSTASTGVCGMWHTQCDKAVDVVYTVRDTRNAVHAVRAEFTPCQCVPIHTPLTTHLPMASTPICSTLPCFRKLGD